VDIDDSIAKYAETFIAYHNREYRTAHTLEQIGAHEWSAYLGISKDEMRQRFDAFHTTESFRNLQPEHGATDSLHLLQQQFRFVSVTARPLEMQIATQHWIQRHFPMIPSHHIYHAKNVHHYSHHGGRSKAEILHELGAKVMVEDSPIYARECVERGIPVLLYNKPWNQQEIPGTKRVHSWKEIHDLLTNGWFAAIANGR